MHLLFYRIQHRKDLFNEDLKRYKISIKNQNMNFLHLLKKEKELLIKDFSNILTLWESQVRFLIILIVQRSQSTCPKSQSRRILKAKLQRTQANEINRQQLLIVKQNELDSTKFQNSSEKSQLLIRSQVLQVLQRDLIIQQNHLIFLIIKLLKFKLQHSQEKILILFDLLFFINLNQILQIGERRRQKIEGDYKTKIQKKCSNEYLSNIQYLIFRWINILELIEETTSYLIKSKLFKLFVQLLECLKRNQIKKLLRVMIEQ
ncbi:unnamed protein product [Paramecium sonneborni]|uniref:Uncharacterized protein n=1 Tax=Paramecium sonneborni TaxID=65129 RepID=A0A8S1PAF9_9CILI|nr:unnamed protein product [Paramecium sonneborni]